MVQVQTALHERRTAHKWAMSWETSYMHNLKGPASESQKNAVLVVCLLVMSVMCIGLIWQAQIIANQREDIKWLQSLKFGG